MLLYHDLFKFYILFPSSITQYALTSTLETQMPTSKSSEITLHKNQQLSKYFLASSIENNMNDIERIKLEQHT